jgi:DNA-binding HxlR family transcriptional regulator/putative sterol carrier protein
MSSKYDASRVSKRTYDQFCPAARALDILGERWTLLVVRELLFGAKRYTDLLTGLPGIGPDMLAARLKTLEAHGIVERRRLPPPAASTVYELTERGRGLGPVLRELFRWGLELLVPREQDSFKASWVLGVMQASFRPQLALGLDETYAFRIDDDDLYAHVKDGTAEFHEGPADQPTVAMVSDSSTFIAIATGRLSLRDAVAQEMAQLTGDIEAAERCFAILGPAQTGAVAG